MRFTSIGFFKGVEIVGRACPALMFVVDVIELTSGAYRAYRREKMVAVVDPIFSR